MNYDRYQIFVIQENDSQRRLDRILEKLFPGMTKSGIQTALRKGLIRLNTKKASPGIRVCTGDELAVQKILTNQFPTRKITTQLLSPELPPVLYEDQHILAIDKPAGMLVHGQNSLEESVRAYLAPKTRESLSFTPGPLHRLDRNTTGIVLFSSSIRGAQTYSEMIRHREIQKYYLGIVEGSLSGTGEWKDLLEKREGRSSVSETGKVAITQWSSLYSNRHYTLVAFHILTGRYHQIRIQSSTHGFPLAGDRKYQAKESEKKYFLHAFCLHIPENALCSTPIMIFSTPPIHGLKGFFSLDESEKIVKKIDQFHKKNSLLFSMI